MHLKKLKLVLIKFKLQLTIRRGYIFNVALLFDFGLE
jgi:hypothetical protein